MELVGRFGDRGRRREYGWVEGERFGMVEVRRGPNESVV